MNDGTDRSLRAKIPDFAVTVFVILAILFIGQIILFFFVARVELRGELLKLFPVIPIFFFLDIYFANGKVVGIM